MARDMHDEWAHCHECDGYMLKAEMRRVGRHWECDGCYWAAEDNG